MRSKLPICVMIICLALGGCRKAIDQKKQDILMSIITDGSWLVQQYLEDSTDISSEFSGYEFKFNSDGSVAALRSGVSTSGTWSGDVSNYTITSSFPGGTDTLKKLDGVWLIKDSYIDYVKAEKSSGGITNHLNLVKKP